MKVIIGDILEIMSVDPHIANNDRYVVGARYRVLRILEGYGRAKEQLYVVENPHIQGGDSYLQKGECFLYKRPIRNWIKSIFSKSTYSGK